MIAPCVSRIKWTHDVVVLRLAGNQIDEGMTFTFRGGEGGSGAISSGKG